MKSILSNPVLVRCPEKNASHKQFQLFPLHKYLLTHLSRLYRAQNIG